MNLKRNIFILLAIILILFISCVSLEKNLDYLKFTSNKSDFSLVFPENDSKIQLCSKFRSMSSLENTNLDTHKLAKYIIEKMKVV
ncbi:hypothetical protein [Tepidibacter mesophilus]|uniref:hypothetical protein n=1 Tax=Tepidibacter mesophilus TaxID=655607 RepID=UPI000C06BC2F|nr:hypothetical protein [Tepidibacter mesophilus]